MCAWNECVLAGVFSYVSINSANPRHWMRSHHQQLQPCMNNICHHVTACTRTCRKRLLRMKTAPHLRSFSRCVQSLVNMIRIITLWMKWALGGVHACMYETNACLPVWFHSGLQTKIPQSDRDNCARSSNTWVKFRSLPVPRRRVLETLLWLLTR